MDCPHCGVPGVTRAIRRCTHCGEAYVAQDLEDLSNLGFLVKETAGWEGTDALRQPYVERLEALRARLVRRPLVKPEAAAPVPIVAEAVAAPAAEPAPARTAAVPTEKPAAVRPRPAPAPPPAPPKEKVPFDQWLLSERNIKIALYAGALLLVAAGMIFVGVNWARIPGPAKFAITLLVTGLMYLGGYLLFRRPALRIGGIALLGVASGFVIVNVAILQLHVLGPAGLRDDVMWLIASPLGLVLYLLTAYWTRGDLFTYLALGALASAATAAVVVAGAPLLALLPVYGLLAYGLLWLVRAVHGTRLADFSSLPLLIVAQGGMAALAVAAVVSWAVSTVFIDPPPGSPWLAILALGVAAVFYATTDAGGRWLTGRPDHGLPRAVTDLLTKWYAARWVAALLLAVTVTLALLALNVGDTVSGLVLMLLALAYLGVGYALQRREERRAGAWPLYTLAYAVALLVTIMAIPDADSLYLVLFGDVLLLVVSAAIHRSYWCIYGAVWLFMLPIYLILTLYVPDLAYRGLFMGLLGLNYALAGYALGRRSLWHGGPFLTAAAFLSVVAVGLTWGNPAIASVVLAVVAVLYLLAALWLGWTVLLLPALLAVHLLVYSVNSIFLAAGETLWQALTISYAALGLVLGLGGLALRHALRQPGQGQGSWAWPLYGAGGLDLAGTYLAALVLGGPLAIGLSAVVAILLLSFAWLERAELADRKLPPLLTYAALAVVFVGHFYVLDLTGIGFERVWPPITAGLCALFVALGWLLRRGPLAGVYGTPLRWVGWVLMAIPLVGAMALSVLNEEPVWAVVTLAIAGLTYGLDGTARQVRPLAWLTLGILFVWHFFVMNLAGIDVEGPWWPITAALCGVFVALGWLLRRGPLADLYGTPLRWAGLALMAIPLVGAMALSVLNEEPVWAVVTLAIAGLTYGLDGTARQVRPLAWLTLGILFVWHFFVMYLAGVDMDGPWWPITAALCGVFVALGWLLRRGPLATLYAAPLRYAGLVLMAIPLVGSGMVAVSAAEPVVLAVVSAIAALAYGADGMLRRIVWLVYLGAGALVVVIWSVFWALGIEEPQAYAIPVGLALLGAGWSERCQGRSLPYQGCTVLGLVVLMGSAFAQSLGRGNWPYSLLLLAESLAAVGWGVAKHLRRWIQVGGVALLANGVAQLGPAVLDLSGWIQLGLVGTILFGGGMLALLKREELLAARQRLAEEWRQWEP